MRMENPAESPCAKPMIRNIRLPVQPTAASAFTPSHAAHNKGVGHVVDLLEQVADEQRQGEQQNQLCRGTGGHGSGHNNLSIRGTLQGAGRFALAKCDATYHTAAAAKVNAPFGRFSFILQNQKRAQKCPSGKHPGGHFAIRSKSGRRGIIRHIPPVWCRGNTSLKSGRSSGPGRPWPGRRTGSGQPRGRSPGWSRRSRPRCAGW